MRNTYRAMCAAITALGVTMALGFILLGAASATPEDTDCPAVIVIHHEAQTHVIHHEAQTHEEKVIDAPEVWANFSPNDKHGTFEGPPSWPTDPNGTWQIHDKIPGGHDGPDGVYHQGNGNGDWFYRQAERSHVESVVDREAYDQVIVDVPARDEEVPNPDYPCETATPTETVEPTPSVSVTPTPTETPTVIPSGPPPTKTPVAFPPTKDITKTTFTQKNRKTIIRKDRHRDGTVTVTVLRNVVETGF